MSEPPFPSPQEEIVAIVGVGLIGGSLAAALKQRKLARWVIGVGRDPKRMNAARDAGLIDEASTDLVAAVRQADLTVFCTPVGQVVSDVRKAEVAIGQSSTRPDPLMTDVGSTKDSICQGLSGVPRFIGSHPIAGSHRQGFEAANPDLFQNRVCVLTPLESAPERLLHRLNRFWQSVGMQTIQMSPAAHDSALAMTSHLPHLVAAALAMTFKAENRAFFGTGFRDTTRLAAGSPDLWTDILLTNATHVIDGIDQMQRELAVFRALLATGDAAQVRTHLANSQKLRTLLDQKTPPVGSDTSESTESG